ncbi:MAG: TonB family protein [Chthoniobacterales bacterium]|nr:TonB family protein [Chthoniobacterales bacterium]
MHVHRAEAKIGPAPVVADNRADLNREIATPRFRLGCILNPDRSTVSAKRNGIKKLVQAKRKFLAVALGRRSRLPQVTVLLSLLLADCSEMNYQDRARTPLKPMQSVVSKKSDAFDVPPQVLEGTRPDYPEPEGERRERGFVSLICTIDAHGRLIDFEIETATSPSFAYEAARAIAKWKFAPAKKDGHPVAGKLRVPMHFNAI